MKRPIFWILVFGALFLLSMDFWNWGEPTPPGWLGLPDRVCYFALLQGLFAAAFVFFAKHFWKDTADEDNAA